MQKPSKGEVIKAFELVGEPAVHFSVLRNQLLTFGYSENEAAEGINAVIKAGVLTPPDKHGFTRKA